MFYKAESFKGRSVGRFNHWQGVQIVAYEDSKCLKRKCVFPSRSRLSPCCRFGAWVAHYKSGLNMNDAFEFRIAFDEASFVAYQLNEGVLSPSDCL